MRIHSALKLAALTALLGLVTACGYDENPPILVAVSDTVGISASAGAADQGAEVALGFKGRKLAIVPVSLTDGERGQVMMALYDGSEFKEKSHSVLATLNAQGTAGTASASVEQVVAVGKAAETWAEKRGGAPQ